MADARLGKTLREEVKLAVALALLSAAAAGCGAPPTARPATNPTRQAAEAPGQTSTPSTAPADPIAQASPTSFEVKRSARFDLAIPLPDGARFSVDDRAERWFVATHAATGSVLRVRVWREDSVGGRARCEERARSWRDLPTRDGSRLVEARRIAVPPDHDTVAEVRIRPRTKTNPAEGTVLAFGGWARKCFAYVFVTADADERIVAARLATMVDGSLARVRVESELSPPRARPDVGEGVPQ